MGPQNRKNALPRCNVIPPDCIRANTLRSLHGNASVLSRILTVILIDNSASSIVLSHEQNSYSSAGEIVMSLGKSFHESRG
jgi:hypothetical protein